MVGFIICPTHFNGGEKNHVVPGVWFSLVCGSQQTTYYIPSFFSVKAEDYIAGTHEDSNYIQAKIKISQERTREF